MLRHCVMFRWNEAATEEVREAITAGLAELAGLECVAAYVYGPDAGLVEGNWDYVVVGDFDGLAQYRTYADDPTHQRLIAELIRPHISERAAVQFVV